MDNLEGNEPQTGSEQVSSSTEQPQVLDLGSVERFKWDGKEWTTQDLKNSVMAHSDYTRKTQALAEERKQYQEQSKYWSALQHDLETLKANPHMIGEFQKIYPAQFHAFAKYVIGTGPKPEQTSQSGQLPPEFRDVADQVAQIKNEIYESKVQSHLAEIESTFSKLGDKYPETKDPDIQELILARAQSLSDKGTKLTEKVWDELFKSVNDKLTQKYVAKQKEQITKQTEANRAAKDSPSGGAIPGQAPKAYKSIKEATAAALEAASRGVL